MYCFHQIACMLYDEEQKQKVAKEQHRDSNVVPHHHSPLSTSASISSSSKISIKMTLRLVIISFLVALLSPIDKSSSTNSPLLFVYANVPPASSRGGRFTRKRNRQTSTDNDDGLTLGDLEAMQQQQQQSNNNGAGTFIPTEAIFGQQREQKQQQQTIEADDESSEQSTQLRRSLRRINLDLSGRVMCHVVSPKMQKDAGDDRATVKMNSMPLFQLPETTTSLSSRTLRRIQRHIPHIYIGANKLVCPCSAVCAVSMSVLQCGPRGFALLVGMCQTNFF